MNKDRKLLALGTAACMTAVLAFGLARLRAYPPHEDEVLALFLGRDSLGGMLDRVLTERGGAPLHYLLAWVVVHLGGGLDALRLVSLACAVASIPLIAALAERLVGPRRALAATALASASWVFLFHALFGRMYALFLVTATASFLALAARRWGWWAVATLAMLAAHPYGALALLGQLGYLAFTRARAALPWAALVVAGAVPLWYAYSVLASRYGDGDAPKATGDYVRESAGDLTSGYVPLLAVFIVLAIVGATRVRARPLIAAAVAPALAALVLAGFTSASPESRHLIFVLPFVAVLVAAGLPGAARVAVPLAAALVAFELAWAVDRTPDLFAGESSASKSSRAAAAAWLARTARPDDVLHGFNPVFLAAWESDR
ncbi:MAG TPA: glycosyltransferase family 39 protein, partial [Gaiellaceae bacterium]|nr:glycosyltransferase family 39 protein [Gaiellaceae bacterium]